MLWIKIDLIFNYQTIKILRESDKSQTNNSLNISKLNPEFLDFIKKATPEWNIKHVIFLKLLQVSS